eukprot:7259804-Lingulodinium_polyedra.AAC.1
MMRLNWPSAGCNGSQIARLTHSMQTPVLAFAWSVHRARFANRCGRERSIRPHHCAKFAKRYTMMRLRSSSAAATAR